MKKLLVLIAALVFCMVAACGAWATDANIKIGYLAALTGTYEDYGQAELWGAKLAVNELNALGGVLGRKLELVPYNWESRTESAINGVRRLTASDKVSVVVGTNISGTNIVIAPHMDKAKVPLIGTTTTSLQVTTDEQGKLRPYSFRMAFTDPYEGKIMANGAIALGKKRGAIFYDNASEYAISLRKFTAEHFTRLGGKIVDEESYIGGDEMDFKADLAAIAKSKADVIFLLGMANEMALIIRQAREMGLNTAIIGGDGYADYMYDVAGKTLSGTYWVSHATKDDPGLKNFSKQYMDNFKGTNKVFTNSVIAYDTIYWIADAIKRAGKADPESIAKALEQTQNLRLNHATLTINPADHNPVNKTAVILRIDEKGREVFEHRINPK